jgi:putative ABC transport system permease protein
MILGQWRDDMRFAWRGLRQAGGFTATAVLTLAVGVAGTTVMFALIQGVLLRPLPVREQDRLIVGWMELRSAGTMHWPFATEDVEKIAEGSQLLERVAGVEYTGAGPAVVVDADAASYIDTASVTGDFFSVLGVEPLIGRALNRTDDLEGAENVLVLTHGAWQRRYGGSPGVIGRQVTVGERPFTIAGVMPPDVEFPRGVEAWMTVAAHTSILTNPSFHVDVDLIARLRPGATIEQATSELHGLIARLEAEGPPDTPRGRTAVVRRYEELVVGDVRRAMIVLFGAVAVVLIIACANVANLLLLRGEARRSDLAVRAALGAGRARLVGHALAESLILAVAAGAAGLTVAWWTLHSLVALVPDGLPRIESVRVDTGVLLFTIGVAFVTAALAGLAPALSSVRLDLASQLRAGTGGAGGGAARHGRRVLVVAQVALAVTIVAVAGLLIRSLLRLQAVDMGLSADRLVFVRLALPHVKYGDRAPHLQFLDDIVAELEARPDIAAATPVNVPPFSGTRGWDVPRFTAEGQSPERAATNPSLNLESIHANYFETFQVALVRGRRFTRADRKGAPYVAIVTEDVAASTWPGQDPIGKRVKFGGPTSEDEWRTVVGVVRPTRYRELAQLRPTLYLPAEQFIVAAHMVVLRTSAPIERVAGLVREGVRTIDADVQVMRVAPFRALLAAPLARPRFNAFLIGVFGAAALLLAAIGLYAVMAAYVRQRYLEIGIRVALGATPSDVRRLVLAEGLRLSGMGAAIGFGVATIASRLLRGLLFDVHPIDPVAMLTASLLLTAAAGLAVYLPARRATRLDPLVTLKAT